MGKRTKKRIERLYNEIVFERRILMLCTVFIGLSIAVWCISITTDYWFIVSGGNGVYIPSTKRYFYTSHSGIWRICRFAFANETTGVSAGFTSEDLHNVTGKSETKGKTTYFTPGGTNELIITQNTTYCKEELFYSLTRDEMIGQNFGYCLPCSVEKCKFHEMSYTDSRTKKDPSIDRTIVNYNRTEAVFAIIALALMIIGFVFSCYTFNNTRYMFKRTAGGIHFLSTGSTLTVIEVVINSIDYERKNIPFTYPPGATHKYGYSFVLAWLVFICNLLSGCAFMVFSRKRKGRKAPDEEIAMADGVTIIGR